MQKNVAYLLCRKILKFVCTLPRFIEVTLLNDNLFNATYLIQIVQACNVTVTDAVKKKWPDLEKNIIEKCIASWLSQT